MFIWTWLVGRVGQMAAGAIGVGLLIATVTASGALVVSWIRSGANAEWMQEINQASTKATAEEKARAQASEKAAQAERDKAQADRQAALDRAHALEQQLQAMKDDPVALPQSIVGTLNK